MASSNADKVNEEKVQIMLYYIVLSDTLLFGSDHLHLADNQNIFAMVHDFLYHTDRLQI